MMQRLKSFLSGLSGILFQDLPYIVNRIFRDIDFLSNRVRSLDGAADIEHKHKLPASDIELKYRRPPAEIEGSE